MLGAGQKGNAVLNLIHQNVELGYAILEGAHDHAYIETYQGDVQTLKDGVEDLVLAVSIPGQGPDSSDLPAYTKASSIMLSGDNTHLFFACATFAGNSSAALVLKQDALVGVYLAGVNALREKLWQIKTTGARLTAAEKSLDAVVSGGLRQGHCALLSHVFSH